MPSSVAMPICATAPGIAIAHGQQVLDREMQADPEHQQDHTQLRQLRRQRLVGRISGRVRPTTMPAHR